MSIYLFALLIGVVAGLRAMTAPAVVSWAAHLGVLPLQQTPFAFLAATVTPYILTALALGELLADPLPSTPSRKEPLPFGTRIATGALSGAAVGASVGAAIPGLVCGVVGAVVGTLGGAAARGRLAQAFGKDLPAALVEDVVAVGGSVLIMGAVT